MVGTPPFRYITESEVEQHLTMPAVIEAVEQAFRELAAGRARNVPRWRVQLPGIVLHSMTAAAEYPGLVVWKQYTTTDRGALFHVGVYDMSGALRLLIEANRLGQMRTGAATAVAARYLSPENADVLALIGTGWQAEAQLDAMATVRSLREVRVYGRDEARRSEFAWRMSKRLRQDIRDVDSVRKAIDGASLVVTATSSRTPVLDAALLADNTFLAAIGSNWPHKAELDTATIQAADRVVCDSIEACQREAGELLNAANSGEFSWDSATELADYVSGRIPPAHSGLRIFKSVGLAIEDLAAASLFL